MVTIKRFEFNPFGENTYVIYDETRLAAIIDPGCCDAHEHLELDQFISRENLKVQYLLNTHCHIDHVLGNFHVKEKYHVPLLIHSMEEPYLRAVKSYASNYGFHHYQETTPDAFLEEGKDLVIGNTTWKIIFVPGHSPGHVGFYESTQKILLSGDVLFERSIGRTDLPGGSFETLIKSIHQKLFILPDAVVVYPGHGNTTTIGEEKIENPFCALNLKA